jgi:hypothetical protein
MKHVPKGCLLKASSISPNYTLLCQLQLKVGKKEEKAHDSYLLLRMKFFLKKPEKSSSPPLSSFLQDQDVLTS